MTYYYQEVHVHDKHWYDLQHKLCYYLLEHLSCLQQYLHQLTVQLRVEQTAGILGGAVLEEFKEKKIVSSY